MKTAEMESQSNEQGRQYATGVIMDPIAGISTHKDSTFAMLLEAQARGHALWYMEVPDLTVQGGTAVVDPSKLHASFKTASDKLLIN